MPGSAAAQFGADQTYFGAHIDGVSYGGGACRIFAGGFVGSRCFFKPNLAGVARVGFGASYLTLGVDFKL